MAPVGGSSKRWPRTRVGCRSAESGGQAPRLAESSTALHFPSPPLPFWIPAFAGMTNSALGKTSRFHFRTKDEMGGREPIPDRSPGCSLAPIPQYEGLDWEWVANNLDFLTRAASFGQVT